MRPSSPYQDTPSPSESQEYEESYLSELPPELQYELQQYRQTPRATYRPQLEEASEIRGTYFQRLPREIRELTERYRRSCSYDVRSDLITTFRTSKAHLTITMDDRDTIITFDRFNAKQIPDFLDGKLDEIFLELIEDAGSLLLMRDDANIYLVLDEGEEQHRIGKRIPICLELVREMRRIASWFS